MSAEPAPEPPPAAEPWRRLNVRMLLVHPVQEVGRAIPALAGLLIAGGSSGNGAQFALIGVVLVIALGLMRWYTTRWRITPDQVELRHGLLNRRARAVSRDRVRTVDVTASPMHRLLGLARVTIGTGRTDRGSDAGLRLDGLLAADGARLRGELLHRATPVEPERPAASDEAEIARLDPAWIRYGPLSLSGLVAVGVVGGFLANAASELDLDPRRVGPLRDVADALEAAPLGAAVASVVLAGLLVVVVLSTLGYVLAFWNFRLTRHAGGTLHVARGLLTSRATSIEERRLRGVELNEPLLQRMAGGARVVAIATGLRAGQGEERGGSLLLPPAPRAEARRVAAAVLGTGEPVDVEPIPHGPAARRRRYTRAMGAALAAVAAAAAVRVLLDWPDWIWEGALVAVPASVALAADRARSLGHAITAGHLVTRSGSVVRRRSALAREGVIGITVQRSWFQRRAGLVTLTATTAAGDQAYAVLDVEAGEGLRVARATVPGLLEPFLADVPRPRAPGVRAGPPRGKL